MKKYFDKARDRLVFIEQVADGIYWDNHWEADNQEFARKLKNTNNRFVLARPNFFSGSKNTLRWLRLGRHCLYSSPLWLQAD